MTRFHRLNDKFNAQFQEFQTKKTRGDFFKNSGNNRLRAAVTGENSLDAWMAATLPIVI